MYISICITTKNRPEEISVFLESLIFLDYKKYELVVVDSSTTQDSSAVIDSFRQENPNSKVKYVYKQCSIDEGYFEAANLSTGEFIWFFSDDDVLLPFAIDVLHTMLSKTPLDFLVINSSLYSSNLSKCESFARIDYSKEKSGIVYNMNSLGELFGEVHGILGYIACILLSRSLFNSYLINHDKVAFSKYFHHLHYVFSTNFKSNSSIKWKILWTPLFITRMNSNSWASNYLYIWGIDFQETCRALINISDDMICKNGLKGNNCKARFLLGSLFHKRGADKFSDYVKKAKCSKLFLLFWIIYRATKILKNIKKS